MTQTNTSRKALATGAGIGAIITALLFTLGIVLSSSANSAKETSVATPESTATAMQISEEVAWSEEQQAMAYYVAGDTVARYLKKDEVTRQWQESLGYWGTENFKEKARAIDPSLNWPGEITGITKSNFALKNSASITVESTAGTFTLTLVPDGDGVKVEQLEVG